MTQYRDMAYASSSDFIAALAALLDVQQHAVDVVVCDFQVGRERERLKHVLRGERHKRTFAGAAGGPQAGGAASACSANAVAMSPSFS